MKLLVDCISAASAVFLCRGPGGSLEPLGIVAVSVDVNSESVAVLVGSLPAETFRFALVGTIAKDVIPVS